MFLKPLGDTDFVPIYKLIINTKAFFLQKLVPTDLRFLKKIKTKFEFFLILPIRKKALVLIISLLAYAHLNISRGQNV